MVLATRFVAFEESCMLTMLYLRNKPLRNYAEFNSHPADTSRPIPSVQWDSMVTNAYRLANIREVHLLNFKLIENMENRDESMVTVLCIFAEVNHDYVPIVLEDRIQPFDMRPREGYRAYR